MSSDIEKFMRDRTARQEDSRKQISNERGKKTDKGSWFGFGKSTTLQRK